MDFIQNAVKANQEIYQLLKDGDISLKKELQKGAGGDISRVVDIKAEEIFVKYLKQYGQIISEESGVIGEGEDSIIIDPIDGSDNFISGLPYFGSSVARKKDKKICDAVICNFANGDIFVKNSTGFKKANLNNLEFSEIISNNYDTIGIFERAYASSKLICEINKMGLKYRSPGALALSLAYAHEFKFVIFEGKIREYDVAAGIYMCEDMQILLEDGVTVVSKDKELFKKITEIVRGVK